MISGSNPGAAGSASGRGSFREDSQKAPLSAKYPHASDSGGGGGGSAALELAPPRQGRSWTVTFLAGGGIGTFSGSVANLCNSAMGASTLALPSVAAELGLVLFVVVSLCMCLLNLSALHAVGRSQQRTNANNYQDAVGKLLGARWQRAMAVAQLLGLFGICVGQHMIVVDQIGPLLLALHPSLTRRAAIALNAVIVLLPLSFIRNMQAMAPLATFATGAIFYALMLLVVRAAVLVGQGAPLRLSPSAAQPGALSLALWPGLPNALGVLAVAYYIHSTYPLVFAELRSPKTLVRMNRVANVAFTLIFLTYTLVGFCGYCICAMFAPKPVFPVPGDVLRAWSGTLPPDVQVAKIAMAITVDATFITLHFAARTCLADLVLPAPVNGFTFRELCAENVLWLASTMGIAMAVNEIDVVFGFIGALIFIPLMFIVPGVLLWHLDGDNGQSKLGHSNWRYNGPAMIAFGIAVSVAYLVTLITGGG